MLGYKFFVPSYQRGYRWSEQQVKELLDDVRDFAKKTDKVKGEFYCLQPVVVRKMSTEEKAVKELNPNEEWHEVIDGQQRLTTLWLMHWYIALKAGELEAAKDVLSKFTYETRLSSRYFCEELCKVENIKNPDEIENISDYITSRTWFSSSWYNDPTITAMLLMLSGTNRDLNQVDKKDLQRVKELNNMADGLEKLFQSVNKEQFRKYWDALTSENPPIYFYQLELKKFGLTDDLYIKMNARGKQLTPFENFKADLIGYIRQRAREKKDATALDKPDHNEDWDALLDPRSGLPIKLDTD